MFSKLFTAGGLSFDRLRVLLEVSASGSITKAANGDPVKQSQYSRQIKELEGSLICRLYWLCFTGSPFAALVILPEALTSSSTRNRSKERPPAVKSFENMTARYSGLRKPPHQARTRALRWQHGYNSVS